MKSLILCIICLVSLQFVCLAQIKTVKGSEITESQLSKFIIDEMERLEMPGLSIVVINNKKIRYKKEFGVANQLTKQPISGQTIFEAASLSKPLFAYWVMSLVDKGIIDLDRPICEYFENSDLRYDLRYRKITPRMVLRHTSGLPNWRYFTNKMNYLELIFPPDSTFGYSGEGYEYLAQAIAIERGFGLGSLDSLLIVEVLNPLDMNSSSFTWQARYDSLKANGHIMRNVPNNRFKPKVARVSGGLHTTTEDYAKFMMSIMEGTDLSPESYQDMLSPAIELPLDNDIRKTFGVEYWTLGFAYEDTENGIKYSHGGNNGDFQSYFEFYQDKGVGYVFMTNSNKGNELNESLNKYLTIGKNE